MGAGGAEPPSPPHFNHRGNVAFLSSWLAAWPVPCNATPTAIQWEINLKAKFVEKSLF